MSPVVTALDLPAGSPGGSVELLNDLYGGAIPRISARLFMLHSNRPPEPPIETLKIYGKCLTGHRFWAYVDALKTALTALVDPDDVAVTHLQHLAFGATPALLRTLPEHPSIALVHGTDLLVAASNSTQCQVLRQSAHRVTAIVVPTPAMARRLRSLAPETNIAKIHHIPWGIPDHLLHQPLTPPLAQDRPFRLLYAGRLTAEKGVETLAATCAQSKHMTLSIAAPADEYARFSNQLQKTGCAHHYLGWLDRHQLWQVFRDHDALVVPSTTLEAFGLVAVEAQACGLPVLYQPVPGLTDVLGDSALPVDFTDPHALTTALRILHQDPSARADLRTAGYGNARRFPISATAEALIALGNQIT
ncbi:glycosyltransferase family 4 protein [Nonomuraea angiospora]|uniref:glycosyltransferase family 4 protein n=1 Tax=Nonomuraea angiospora TaxID=46172 RepID=UPI0029BEDCC7|nr:glycosyltransferase family 4 protein [Nonomuraea angiospora]MDX3099992.1 glycosyltransferase family 4 protein [Nonomuraea angiospora]